MEEKQNHNKSLKIIAIIFAVLFVLTIPNQNKAQAGFNAIGVHVGGNITTLIPGYGWCFPIGTGCIPSVCPPHVLITVRTPLYLIGEIGIILPPAIPRAHYNYSIPGLAYIGAYYPFPINWLPVFGCPYPYPPIYFGSEFGTSAIPSK